MPNKRKGRRKRRFNSSGMVFQMDMAVAVSVIANTVAQRRKELLVSPKPNGGCREQKFYGLSSSNGRLVSHVPHEAPQICFLPSLSAAMAQISKNGIFGYRGHPTTARIKCDFVLAPSNRLQIPTVSCRIELTDRHGLAAKFADASMISLTSIDRRIDTPCFEFPNICRARF